MVGPRTMTCYLYIVANWVSILFVIFTLLSRPRGASCSLVRVAVIYNEGERSISINNEVYSEVWRSDFVIE